MKTPDHIQQKSCQKGMCTWYCLGPLFPIHARQKTTGLFLFARTEQI